MSDDHHEYYYRAKVLASYLLLPFIFILLFLYYLEIIQKELLIGISIILIYLSTILYSMIHRCLFNKTDEKFNKTINKVHDKIWRDDP